MWFESSFVNTKDELQNIWSKKIVVYLFKHIERVSMQKVGFKTDWLIIEKPKTTDRVKIEQRGGCL